MDDDIKLELYTLDEPSMENTVIVETTNNSVYGVSPKRVKHCNNTTSESNSESAVSNGGVACVSVAMYQDDTIPNGHSLFELYQQRLFCDITLVAGDKTRFPAHRNVLCAANTIFNEELIDKESSGGKQKMVLDKEVSAETTLLMIEYCYTGRVIITNENVDNLLYAANLYEFRFLKKKGIDFLVAQINSNSALHIWRLAHMHRSSRLLRASATVVCDAFMQLTNTEAFQMLSIEQLLQWVNCDDIYVGSEEDVFCAIVRWISARPNERITHYAKLLRAVRLTGISTEYLHGPVLKFSREIDNANEFLTACDRRSGSVEKNRKPRVAMCLLAVGGNDPNDAPNQITIEQFNVRLNAWVELASIAEERLKYQVTHDNERIWITGGCDSIGVAMTKAICIPLATLATVSLPDMPTPRYNHGAVVLNDQVYAIGGQNSDGYLASVVKFDSESHDAWETLEPLATPRAMTAVVAFNDQIYVIGGCDTHNHFQTVERYSLVTKKWSPIAALNKRRSDASAVVSDGSLVVFGGWDGKALHHSFEVYNAAEDKWHEHLTTDNLALGVGLAVENDWVYIAGGNDDHGRTQTVTKFNRKTSRSRAIIPMLAKRSRFKLIHRHYFVPQFVCNELVDILK